jgi:AcrR family transcriptional regulator
MLKKTAQDWIEAGRLALIEEGVAGLKVDRLAHRLGVSRGSFYHYFIDREGFLARLIGHWRERCCFLPAPPPTLPAAAIAWLDELARRLIESDGYDPRFDLAVREWGRANSQARAAVEAADRDRIDGLQGFFEVIGYESELAAIRARIFYFHQIGYHAIGVDQSAAERTGAAQTYIEILCGGDAIATARSVPMTAG